MRAQAYFHEGLTIVQEMGRYPRHLAFGIAGMAGVILAAPMLPDSARRAAPLLGVALLQWERAGVPPELTDARDLEWLIAAARAQLGDDAFAAAWEAGRAMPLEQAIEEALSAVDSESG